MSYAHIAWSDVCICSAWSARVPRRQNPRQIRSKNTLHGKRTLQYDMQMFQMFLPPTRTPSYWTTLWCVIGRGRSLLEFGNCPPRNTICTMRRINRHHRRMALDSSGIPLWDDRLLSMLTYAVYYNSIIQPSDIQVIGIALLNACHPSILLTYRTILLFQHVIFVTHLHFRLLFLQRGQRNVGR